MSAIVIGVDPTIAQIGPFALRWYTLFFASAVVAGVWLGLREAARKRIDLEGAQTLVLWAVVGGLIGARLFHVVDRWELYSANPLAALNVSQGGLAVEGGLVGGLAAGLAYAWWAHLPVARLADAAAPGMILRQALGRFACIPNGDAYGAPANVPWAFVYTNPHAFIPASFLGIPTHPYPVYEMLFDLAVLAMLWRLRGALKSEGSLFLVYVVLYGVGRFLLTYYRLEKLWFWGLQEAQIIALLGVFLALPLLVWLLWSSGGSVPRPGRHARQPA
jgi:phosphatidylglycerol---prolipoprotein diacylglyceryl transferase